MSLNQILSSKAFIRLLVAQTLATFSDGLWRVTLLTIVLTVGGSAADLTAVMLAGVLPAMILSAVGGTWADHFSPVKLVQLTQISRALLLMALFFWFMLQPANLTLLLVTNILLSALSALANPAYNTLLPRVVPADDLATGNAAFATGDSLAFALAPALAGAYLIIGKPENLLLVGGLLLLSMVALLWRIPELENFKSSSDDEDSQEDIGKEQATYSPLNGLREAWNWIKNETGAVTLLLCFAAVNLVTPAGMVTLPLYAQTLAHPAAYGWLLSAMGIGTLLASILLTRWPFKHLGWLTGLAAIASGLLSHIGLGLSGGSSIGLPLALILVLLGDALFTIPNILFPTWLQKRVPSPILGRVFGLIGVMSYALVPLGYLVAPLLLVYMSPSQTLILLGAVLVIVGISALRLPEFRRLQV